LSHEDLYQKMADSVITGEAEAAAALARQSLELGIAPLESIDNGFVKGIRVVGDRFGAGELFLPELVMSAEAMKAALAILEPELAKSSAVRESQGSVLACTVQGDIHDIGSASSARCSPPTASPSWTSESTSRSTDSYRRSRRASRISLPCPPS